MVSPIRLDGKVAVVTGATGGWGSGAAIALAARGASVVLNARTQSKLDGFAEELQRRGGQAIGVAQDVRTLDGAVKLVGRTVEEYGRVDVLVNCAGVRVSDTSTTTKDGESAYRDIYGGALVDLTEENWGVVIDAELTMVFVCTKAAVVQMLAQGEGGSVVTVVGSYLGAAGQSAHAAAKSGVLGATWSWADELKQHGITVNGIRGYVRSLLTDPRFDTQGHDFESGRDTPALPTEPADAGEIVAWLASSEARHVTGRYLGLDGPRVTMWDPTVPDTAVFHYPRWTADDMARIVGPMIGRRPARPSMVDVVTDLFDTSTRENAIAARARFALD